MAGCWDEERPVPATCESCRLLSQRRRHSHCTLTYRKTVGAAGAMQAILQATYEALSQVDGFAGVERRGRESLQPPLDRQVFKKVWLGLAGVMHRADIEAFAPFAREAFHIPSDDDEALRITNGETSAGSCRD